MLVTKQQLKALRSPQSWTRAHLWGGREQSAITSEVVCLCCEEVLFDLRSLDVFPTALGSSDCMDAHTQLLILAMHPRRCWEGHGRGLNG